MEPIRALISALTPLRAAGIALDAEAVAEALWLARLVADGQPEPEPDAPEPRPGPPAPRTPRPPAPESEPTTAVAVSAYGAAEERGPGGTSGAAGGIGVPRVPAVPHKPAVLSELRPLARRGPEPGREVFDEERTVERTAVTRVPWPVTRPEQLRRRDLCLVLDRDPTMAAWEGLADEVTELFRALGAFRRVEVWYAQCDERGRMRLAARPQAPVTVPMSALRDPSGRRIVVLLTAALGEAWARGTAAAELSRLAECAPVAVAQPLPAELWARTGLAWAYGRIAPATPGAPSALKLAGGRGGGADEGGEHGGRLTPVPVFELKPGWLGPWARTLTGDGSPARYPVLRLAESPGVRRGMGTDMGRGAGRECGAAPAPVAVAGSPWDRQRGELGADARQQVDHFRSASSADAYRLAVLLSVASLTPPVMRLIQRVMMPGSDPSVLAEVIAGGLLEAVPGEPKVHALTEDHRAFVFRPRVAEMLRRGLRRSDSFEVHAATSQFLEAWLNVPARLFQATLSLPSAGPGGPLPFAFVRPAVLGRVSAAFGTTPGVMDYGELARFRAADPAAADARGLRTLLNRGLGLLAALPVGDGRREGVLDSVIDITSRLWAETGDPAVLDEAIALGKASLAELADPGRRVERMVDVAGLLLRQYERTDEVDALVECSRLLYGALDLNVYEPDSPEAAPLHETLAEVMELLGEHTREPMDLMEAAAHYLAAKERTAPAGRRAVLGLREVLARLGVAQLRASLGEAAENVILGAFREACEDYAPGDQTFSALRDTVLRRAAELPVAELARTRLATALEREAEQYALEHRTEDTSAQASPPQAAEPAEQTGLEPENGPAGSVG